MNKLLIYTACDKKYEIFIPLFCLSHLIFNKNIDIEIAVESNSLSDNNEKILDIIRRYYSNSKIVIDYNSFNYINGKAIMNNIITIPNSIRFLLTPSIKNEYTYITDIDIICCEEIITQHLDDMKKYKSSFSNRVRPETTRLTGLHFTKTSEYYPIPIDILCNQDYLGNDEMLLYKLVSYKQYVDLKRTFRPVHGIHMSLNRPNPGGTNNIPGWGADKWKEEWQLIISNIIYKKIESYFDSQLLSLIIKLNKYYKLI